MRRLADPPATAIATTDPPPVLVPKGAAPQGARHPVNAYLSTLAEGASRETMARQLGRMAVMFGQTGALTCQWWRLEHAHVAWLRSRLQAEGAPSSANVALCALRGVLKASAAAGLITFEAMHRALAGAKSVRGSRVPKGRAVEGGELRSLFKECDAGTAVGARDAALLSLLYGCGLRRSEVVGLDVTAFRASDGALVVRGKGNKERVLYLTNGALEAVKAWLSHRGDAPGPMLYACRKGDHLVERRLTPGSVRDRLAELAERAGVESLSPHDMRRSFVGDLLDSGVDISTVQQLAGHASVTTTARYDRRGEHAKRKAVGALHVPFVRRAAEGAAS